MFPVINCMHAVAGIIGDVEFGNLRGRRASQRIDAVFNPYYIDYEADFDVLGAFQAFERGN